MTKITLIGAAPIDGKMRYPSEGEQDVAPEVAQGLVDAGLAREVVDQVAPVESVPAVTPAPVPTLDLSTAHVVP